MIATVLAMAALFAFLGFMVHKVILQVGSSSSRRPVPAVVDVSATRVGTDLVASTELVWTALDEHQLVRLLKRGGS